MDEIKLFNSSNSKEWLSSLLSYFMSIKSIDDNIESLRIALCSQNDFTPNQLFHYLDLKNKDFLLLNDFVKFLNEMQIPFEEEYVRKCIHNFDKDNDFCLNFQEFLGLILPKKNIDLKNKILVNINNTYISHLISENTKNIFGKLLCEELELVKNCIKTAKFCRGSKGFTFYLGFIEIAGGDRYITENHLFNFLKKNNINISTNDMHQLMFRVDADNDGKISFNEFEEIFFPMKEGELTYKNNNIEDENNYNFYTISSLSDINQKQEKTKKTFNNNNISIRLGSANIFFKSLLEISRNISKLL
jgi:Ca2+-binding EF-hand superfamily protein